MMPEALVHAPIVLGAKLHTATPLSHISYGIHTCIAFLDLSLQSQYTSSPVTYFQSGHAQDANVNERVH